MDVLFLFSRDELYTLICGHKLTDAGQRFVDTVLEGAKKDALSHIVEKRFAVRRGETILLEPVISMLIESIAKADTFSGDASLCELTSPWVSVRCETDPHAQDGFKLTPLPGAGSSRADNA